MPNPKAVIQRYSVKKVFLKCGQIHLCLRGFFNKVDSNRGSSCEYGESFKNIYFEVHLWTAAFENVQTDEREVKARFSVCVIGEYGKNNIAKKSKNDKVKKRVK